MKKIVFFLYLLIHISVTIFSQDTNSLKYLPLRIGNSWTYIYSLYSGPNGCSYVVNYKILDSTIQNGHYYYSFISRRTGQGCNTYLTRFFVGFQNIRIDSFSSNIYKNLNESCIFDSINSALNDSRIACQYYSGNIETCTEFYTLTIFGITRPYKKFQMFWGEQFSSTIYVKDLGVYSSQYSVLTTTSLFTLRGCVINGVLYGDTSLTAISQISTEIPESFSLKQNYPNPFNPTTKILFQIPLLRGVDAEGRRGVLTKLTMYDILGREITTLVNEQLSPGTYEVEFDGTNYPSGVYFYTLASDYFKETRKMVLIK